MRQQDRFEFLMGNLTEDEKARLKAALSALPEARTRLYLTKCDRNPYAALAMYDYNTKLSAALFETIAHFEVDFRSRLDRALSERHAFKKRKGDWLDDKHREFTDRASQAIADAKQDAKDHRKAGRGTHDVERGHVIAELNLSFWRRLIDARYERIYGSAVMRLYRELRISGKPVSDMSALRGLVDPIHTLRNRVAHHEPIWSLECVQRRDDMVSLIEFGSVEFAAWVRSKCRLDDIVTNGWEVASTAPKDTEAFGEDEASSTESSTT